MKIIINPRSKFPDRGPCVQMIGEWVTPKVHAVVSRLIADNWMDSPVYKARIKAHAFFQGGYSDPNGKWILLEFWAAEEACQDFLEILNTEVNKVIDKNNTTICVTALTNNDHHIKACEELCKMLADDTESPVGTPVDAITAHCRQIFLPENNVQYGNLYLLLRHDFSKVVHATSGMGKVT